VPVEPSLFARFVDEWLGGEPVAILDVGAGTGRDASYFAGRGHEVTALDYTLLGMRRTRRRRRRRELSVTARSFNLEDLRSVLVTGARVAHEPGTREIYARGLLDAVGPTGRDNFWRFASMTQRRGGHTFVEFRTPRSRAEDKFFGVHQRTYLSPDSAVREVEAYGGQVVERVTGRDLAPLGEENPHICRLVVRWKP
jgi:cyclopropane fatty-acyl-phospholipid synthase-like methyltransferase